MRAISRAVAVLRTFTADEPLLPLSAIAARAGIDPGTTRRVLLTLSDEGLIAREADGAYRLTHGILAIANAVTGGDSLRELAGADLARLSQATECTVFLSVLQGREALCLERLHGSAPVQVRWWAIGGTMPLNCGAAPKTLLAFMPRKEIDAVLRRPLPALTPHSQTDSGTLRRELEQIRTAGWSLARDDVVDGLSALAVPLRDGDGHVVAAISIGGLTPAITGSSQPKCLSALQHAAASIELRLAGGG